MLPELDANQAQIQRIVSSKVFKTSEVHRNLFTYLAEKSLSGDAQNLKEYTVGLDVFGKPASYDPRQESVVRMHVGKQIECNGILAVGEIEEAQLVSPRRRHERQALFG